MRKCFNRNISSDHKGFSETVLKLEIVSGYFNSYFILDMKKKFKLYSASQNQGILFSSHNDYRLNPSLSRRVISKTGFTLLKITLTSQVLHFLFGEFKPRCRGKNKHFSSNQDSEGAVMWIKETGLSSIPWTCISRNLDQVFA